jgi:uncharacterized tellurite resistance protein B-like protein
MLKIIKKYLVSDYSDLSDETTSQEEKIQIATCVLLLEMANVDDDFSISEKTIIRKILEEDMGIPEENIEEIMDIASKDRQNKIDLFEYTSLINKNFSLDEKQELIEKIWKVIYADGVLDKYEDYLVHKLAQILHIDHGDLIAAKMKIKPK